MPTLRTPMSLSMTRVALAVILTLPVMLAGVGRASCRAQAVPVDAPSLDALIPADGISGPVTSLALDPHPTGPVVAESRLVAAREARIEVWPARRPGNLERAGAIAIGARIVDIVLDGDTAWARCGTTRIGRSTPRFRW